MSALSFLAYRTLPKILTTLFLLLIQVTWVDAATIQVGPSRAI